MIDTRRTPFLNCFIDNVSFDEAVEVIREHVRSRAPGFMVSVNTDIVIRLESDSKFRKAFNAASLVLMDSQPLMLVARLRGIHVREKLSGSDLMPRMCEVAAREQWKCYFLGGREGVPERAANNLKDRFPDLMVCGTLSPEFGFQTKPGGVEGVAAQVREADPDILFICLGTPKSEKILYEHLEEFGVPFTLSVGAAIDFCAGNVSRAPLWMQNAGLEWFYRFLQEPRRLFKRYFVDSWQFLAIACKYRGEAHRAPCR